MKAHYEDLVGDFGERINFRARRYRPNELFESSGPSIIINGIDHRLINISMSGIAVIDKDSRNKPEVGQPLPIQVLSDNTPLFEANGKVVRLENTNFGTKIALRFTDNALNLKDVANAYHDAVFNRKISLTTQVANCDISTDYRLLCADTLHWLRMNRAIVSDFEHRMADDLKHQEKMKDLVDRVFNHTIGEWRRIVDAGNHFTEKLLRSRSDKLAAKSLSESLLTPEFIKGPVWNRSFNKPLGYPGDYLIMNGVYTGADQGNTAYSQLLHRYGLDNLRSIVARKDAMRNILITELRNADHTRPLKVTNLAAGTAQEIYDLLTLETVEKNIDISLIDQDVQAISFSYERMYPLVVQQGGNASLTCFHSSFTELMKGGALEHRLQPQDVIYSLGLFDYFKQPRAKSLVETLYRHVAPGGLLVIGNLKPSYDGGRWAAELICDWPMIYRTQDQMMDLAADLPGANVDLQHDATDQVYLLCVRKDG